MLVAGAGANAISVAENESTRIGVPMGRDTGFKSRHNCYAPTEYHRIGHRAFCITAALTAPGEGGNGDFT